MTAREVTGVEIERAAKRRKEFRGSCSVGGPGGGPQGISTVRHELLVPFAGEWAAWGRPTAPFPGGEGSVPGARPHGDNYVETRASGGAV